MAAVTSSAAGIILALRNCGPWSLVISGLIGGAVSAPISMLIAGWTPKFALDTSRLHELARTGLKFSASDIVDYFRLQSANVFISHTIGPAATGIYNRAHSLSQMPIELTSGSTYQVLFRGLSKVDSTRQARELFLKTITLLALYSTPIYVAIWWLADVFIVILYGEKWRFTAEVIEILALNGLYTIGPACGAVIAARGALGKALIIKVEALVILLLALFLGVKYGVSTAAWIIVATRLYLNLRIIRLVSRTLNLKSRDIASAFFPAYLTSMVLFCAFYLVDLAYSYLAFASNDATYFFIMAAAAMCVTMVFTMLTKQNTIRNEKLRWVNWVISTIKFISEKTKSRLIG